MRVDDRRMLFDVAHIMHELAEIAEGGNEYLLVSVYRFLERA